MKHLKRSLLLVSMFWAFCPGNNVYSQGNFIVAGYHDSTLTYYNFNPDTVIQTDGNSSSESLSLDFDNDGTVDFAIVASSYTAIGSSQSGITFISNGENRCVLGRVDTVYGYTGPRVKEVLKMQNLGDTIDNNLNFTKSSKYITLNNYQEGYHFFITDWINVGEKYIAFEFVSKDTTYYGWIRIEVTDIGSVSIKDCAFNKRAYLGVDNTWSNSNNFISVFPNPANNFVNVKTSSDKLSKVEILDISGKLLKTIKFRTSVKLGVQNFNKGVYFLKIKTNDRTITKRIVVN